MEWDSVLARAREHSVIPFLAWNIHHHCRNDVPAEVLEKLRAAINLRSLLPVSAVIVLATSPTLLTKTPFFVWPLWATASLWLALSPVTFRDMIAKRTENLGTVLRYEWIGSVLGIVNLATAILALVARSGSRWY